MNKRILLSILFLTVINTGVNGMQLARRVYAAPGQVIRWAAAAPGRITNAANEQFDQVVGAGRTADQVRLEHQRLCSEIIAADAILETTCEENDPTHIYDEQILDQAFEKVPNPVASEEVELKITELVANNPGDNIGSLEESVSQLKKNSVQELRSLSNDISLGKLTYREAISKASPYVKMVLRYLIYTSILVALCNMFLPESISTPISSSYWYMLSLPVSATWWTIKLPFKPLLWLLKTYDLQDQLNRLGTSLDKQVKTCTDVCLKKFSDYVSKNPDQLNNLKKFCMETCKK